MSDDEPRDPFLDEDWGRTPWHDVLRNGEMVFLGLAELPTIGDVAEAMKNMPASDLKAMVLERLYMWHTAAGGEGFNWPPDEWLGIGADPDE